ncbi:MAG: tryptophan-rich sensory protein [Fimbriimonadaceae bacterium]|nr:MAG: tryptophan-rich sensory protein [Fimbriimonadaceae bacterium]
MAHQLGNDSQLRTSFANRSKWDVLAVGLGLLAVSGIGGWITAQSIQTGWYAELQKSTLNPPNSIFGPVWTTLYVLMFVAYLLVKKQSQPGQEDYKAIMGVNLLVNLAWTLVFFGSQSIVGGLAVIVAYFFVCIFTAANFAKYSNKAAWMIAPLIAWVGFASYLNFAIWRLNGG